SRPSLGRSLLPVGLPHHHRPPHQIRRDRARRERAGPRLRRPRGRPGRAQVRRPRRPARADRIRLPPLRGWPLYTRRALPPARTPVNAHTAHKLASPADRPGHTEHAFRIAGGGTYPLDARTAWNNPQLVADDSGNINYGAPRLSKNNAWTEAAREGVRRPVTFLADAAFLVSLTGHTPLLEQVAADLERPARLLCLGRRAHPPAHPLLHTLLDGNQHDSWPHQVPLLPVATTTTPQAWVETSPGEGTGVVAYEQPPSPPRRGGGHGPLLLSHITTQPPAATLEA